MPRTPRRAFTLVELLVALAVLAVLLALLLCAVQKCREAACRCACSSNLRQLALAALNYADSAGGCLPHGGSTPECARLYGPGHAGWGYAVLPYCGGESACRLPTWAEISNAPLPAAFNCPSRRGPTRAGAGGPSVSDYAGLARTAAEVLGPIWAPAANGEQYYFGWVWGFPAPRLAGAYDGAITRLLAPGGRGAALTDFPRGTSNTLLFAEKRLCRVYYGGGWWTDYSGPGGGWTDAAMPVWPGRPPGRAQCGPVRDGPGSAHPAAMNAARCDGSAHAVSYSVAGDVFARSCARR